MKLKSIFVSVFALAALASCNNDDEIVNNIPSGASAGAYLSLAINMPQSTPGTRAPGPDDAGPGDAAGTVDEQEVKSALVVGMLSDNSVEVYELKNGTPNEIGQPGVAGSAATAGDAFQVSPKLKKIFVVLNPSKKAKQQISTANGAMSSSQVFKAIEEEVAEISTAGTGYMMTSEGSIADGAWTAVTPTVAASDAVEAINKAKEDAKKNAIAVKVDRTVSKVTLAVSSPNVENGTASVDNFLMNTTNKSYLPYADLIEYSFTASDKPAKYRKDTNWTALALTDTAFNWLKNTDTYTWLAPGSNAYCHENTMEEAAQNYNNTTKMVIKAQFTPDGIDTLKQKSKSWFRVGGVIMTFAELDASYANASATDKKKYEAFLDKLLGAARTQGWTNEGKAATVTLADLDAVTNGGYKAATVENQKIDGEDANMYLIEYYQKSVCYYDVNIKHDNRVDAKKLGRWGMVRNNWYTLTVNKISKAGKPYIPDPTDPDITDPTNPDPENPIPDDEDAAFISVSITVNNWTTWSQGVDL